MENEAGLAERDPHIIDPGDEPYATDWGFTVERWGHGQVTVPTGMPDSYLWLEDGVVTCSLLNAQIKGVGFLKDLFQGIERSGFRVSVPTPSKSLTRILCRNGFLPRAVEGELGMLQLWEHPGRPESDRKRAMELSCAIMLDEVGRAIIETSPAVLSRLYDAGALNPALTVKEAMRGGVSGASVWRERLRRFRCLTWLRDGTRFSEATASWERTDERFTRVVEMIKRDAGQGDVEAFVCDIGKKLNI